MKKSRLLGAALLALAGTAIAAAPLWASEGGYSHAQLKDLGYRIICFAVFGAILFRFARRPIADFFRERRESIARNLEYLETQARNLEEQKEIMSKQISDIASERDAILAQYERLGRKEAARIMEEAQAAADQLMEKAALAAEMEIKTARQALLAEVAKLSAQAAREMVRRNVNDEDQRRLTRDFMEQVEKLAAGH